MAQQHYRTPFKKGRGFFPSVKGYIRLTICYLIEYAEDWASEGCYIREDMILGQAPRADRSRLTLPYLGGKGSLLLEKTRVMMAYASS